MTDERAGVPTPEEDEGNEQNGPVEPPPGEQTEFSDEDDAVTVDRDDLANFDQAVLWGTDWTVETVLAQIRRQNIEINPQFQRRDAWAKPAKSRFIESIILGLPIPQVVLAERRDQRGRYLILDGKQRLLAIMQFAGLADASPNNNFGLSGLEARPDLARKKYRHFETRPELSGELNAFLSHTIRAVVIRNWPSMNFLHVVFHRLNSGSLKLSPQELRQALVPGEFTAYADQIALDAVPLHRLLNRQAPDPRMRDTELLVRYLALRHFLADYFGRMKEFLDDACDRFNRRWVEMRPTIEEDVTSFLQAIEALEQIFGENSIARKAGSNLFNRSIFDALAYYAADEAIRNAMLESPQVVRQTYTDTLRDQEFQDAIESDTAGIPHTATRLQIWGNNLSHALGIEINVPQVQENAFGQMRFVV